jgi:hypothetical protein
MANEKQSRWTVQYEPGSWNDGESLFDLSLDQDELMGGRCVRPAELQPNVRDQTQVLELMGRINYKIIKGGRVYIEVGGVVYKTLYGGYWRSVFTGVEHYLFRCEQVSGFVWAEENNSNPTVDLPIVYSNDGWTASGHSLSFMLARE